MIHSACVVCLIAATAGQSSPDTLRVATRPAAPALDGRADEREYGPVRLRLQTAAGEVRVWTARHADYFYIAAILPDTSFAWGDDFVVSIDPDGSGGTDPGAADRQWYLRRVLDSSVVLTASGDGRWYPAGTSPASLGATRHHADWDVASTSTAVEWTVELRVRAAAVKPGAAAPRLAIRTYNDQPRGWWSLPAPPPGMPAQRVERAPNLWIPLRLE